MLVNPRILLLSALSFTAFSIGSASWGAQGAELERLRPETFREALDPQERISGQNPVGVVMVGSGDHVSPRALYAFAPGWAGELQLSISTVDGRYLAEPKYRK